MLDIHTHKHATQPEGVINLRLTPHYSHMEQVVDKQHYSVGIHPWDVSFSDSEQIWNRLREEASKESVVAIGECGVDLKCGEPIHKQLLIFKKQIDLSEELKKPVIIHDVKGDDIICGLRRDLKPTQPWCIHGFRGKPAAAKALIKAGCFISFGEKFNPETLIAMPIDRILAETDESAFTIENIISHLSEIRGTDLTETIRNNSKIFCNFVF